LTDQLYCLLLAAKSTNHGPSLNTNTSLVFELVASVAGKGLSAARKPEISVRMIEMRASSILWQGSVQLKAFLYISGFIFA